ncbi:hypothetical protein D3C71_2144090 [compost metagenome]
MKRSIQFIQLLPYRFQYITNQNKAECDRKANISNQADNICNFHESPLPSYTDVLIEGKLRALFYNQFH